MKMYKMFVTKCLLVSLLALIPAAAAAQNQTLYLKFDTPVKTASAESPGKWYPDRHAPCGFVSPQKAPDGRDKTLQESVCPGDFQTPDSFYNTQGRKYDLTPTTYSTTISVYVPSSWGTTNARLAGFWATAVNSNNVAGNDYPIIEFQGPITSDAGGPGYYFNNGVAGFYGWDNTTGAFVLIGLPPDFKYDDWVDLTITVIPGQGFIYTVSRHDHKKGVSLMSPFFDPLEVTMGNVILEAYNYGTPYSIYWNNLSFSFTSLSCKK